MLCPAETARSGTGAVFYFFKKNNQQATTNNTSISKVYKSSAGRR